MVHVEGGTTKKPLVLYYRDAVECLKFLIGNPVLRDHMDFVPRHEYDADGDRLYNEMMTANGAHILQVILLIYSCESCLISDLLRH